MLVHGYVRMYHQGMQYHQPPYNHPPPCRYQSPHKYSGYDGINSGVPTRTTPTLTPTTLRNIEQSFIDMQASGNHHNPHQNQAGFVPPVVQPTGCATFVTVDSKSWQGGSTTVMPEPRPSSVSSITSASPPLPNAPRRNTGGRRPNNAEHLSPEEVGRRDVRRERNKMAAARCRKRRMDHTQELTMETEGLDDARAALQNEIQMLQNQKEELEFILESHKNVCKNGALKEKYQKLSIPVSSSPSSSPAGPPMVPFIKQERLEHQESPPPHGTPPPHVMRPTSLPVTSLPPPRAPHVLGVPLQTPSSCIPINFESLMDGGTGFTPVGTGLTPVLHMATTAASLTTPVSQVNTPAYHHYMPPGAQNSSDSCSSQQRSSSSGDLSSPESMSNHLVSL